MTYEDILEWLVFVPVAMLAIVAIWYVVRSAWRDKGKWKD
jgi:hypothetical protein